MESVFASLLRPAPPRAPLEGLEAWWARHLALREAHPAPIDCAIAGGFQSDRVGYAFASGYAEALRTLVPRHAVEGATAFCVTEREGGHPKAIQTTLRPHPQGGFVLDGHKTYATMSTFASHLLVAVREGERPDGRPILKMARVPASADGVALRPLPDLPFAPEIPHAEVTFTAVRVPPEAVLPGDGYDAYVKPFRTIEDIHVHAALLGYLVGVAGRASWPREEIARAVAILGALRDLAARPALGPETHVGLAGAIDLTRRLVAEVAPRWADVEDEERARFERDRGLFEVAGNARRKRIEVAWQALGR